MTRVRLDTLLAERGLFPSRSRAAASVMAGDVLLLPARERASKPGQMVALDVQVEVVAALDFVSRGGVKLANALSGFGLAVEGRRALDVGASTGGFTDCLLQRRVEHVIAVDVAYGELNWRLRSDPRVTVIERRNARTLASADLEYQPNLIVIDVSFISLTKVLPAVLACAAPRFDCMAMVKPQFEVGRERVGKGGVVREVEYRRDALRSVAASGLSLDAGVYGFAGSGLPGPKGNLETFIWFGEAGRAGALSAGALKAAVLAVEP
jgi:23S rRNA (cytidine1920-2'-O)/16S rRNA (cytidine1409-2'-O)-methyltransferase